MSSYVSNKIVLPKNIYEQYFKLDKEDDYDAYALDKLKKPQDNEYRFYIYGYGENSQRKSFVERPDGMIELYFDTKSCYPIQAILNLFKICQSPKIEWYCCEEELVYISRFTWDSEQKQVQEEVFYLESNLECARLFDDDVNNESIFDGDEDYQNYEIMWYFHPEKRSGWQKVSSDNLLLRYEDKMASSAVDEIQEEKALEWITISDGKSILKLCLEWWFYDNFDVAVDKGEDSSWFKTSWLYAEIKEGYDWLEREDWVGGYRQRIFRRNDIKVVYQKICNLLDGKLKGKEHLVFDSPVFEMIFVPEYKAGGKPYIKLKIQYRPGKYKTMKLIRENLVPLVKAFEDAREGIYYEDSEGLDFDDDSEPPKKFERILD